mmetsp:Transcript_20691/g.73082  ORF Transcript_20691/g.73082 Transcript_20691/m.73082 type:complete len:303 (+) Transcript_20691:1834-2742(+)
MQGVRWQEEGQRAAPRRAASGALARSRAGGSSAAAAAIPGAWVWRRRRRVSGCGWVQPRSRLPAGTWCVQSGLRRRECAASWWRLRRIPSGECSAACHCVMGAACRYCDLAHNAGLSACVPMHCSHPRSKKPIHKSSLHNNVCPSPPRLRLLVQDLGAVEDEALRVNEAVAVLLAEAVARVLVGTRVHDRHHRLQRRRALADGGVELPAHPQLLALLLLFPPPLLLALVRQAIDDDREERAAGFRLLRLAQPLKVRVSVIRARLAGRQPLGRLDAVALHREDGARRRFTNHRLAPEGGSHRR